MENSFKLDPQWIVYRIKDRQIFNYFDIKSAAEKKTRRLNRSFVKGKSRIENQFAYEDLQGMTPIQWKMWKELQQNV